MRTGTGAPERIAVVGASSEIAQAAVRALQTAGGLRSAVLVVRDPASVEAFAGELGAAGVQTRVVAWDAATGATGAGPAVAEVFAPGGPDLDLLLIAVGQLGDQAAVEADPALLDGLTAANFTGPAGFGLHAATRMEAQGHGTIAVLSSVAGERARADNFAYGSTKAALDAVFTGLGDRLHGSGVSVVVVRPGFVHTRMTAGLHAAPFSTTPPVVGEAVARAVAAGATRTVWVPVPLRPLMAVLRHLPRPLFRKLAATRG